MEKSVRPSHILRRGSENVKADINRRPVTHEQISQESVGATAHGVAAAENNAETEIMEAQSCTAVVEGTGEMLQPPSSNQQRLEKARGSRIRSPGAGQGDASASSAAIARAVARIADQRRKEYSVPVHYKK